MVDIKQFNKLPLSKKLNLVYKNGALMSARVKGDILVYLYSIATFFVEVHHQYGTRNRPVVMVLTSNSALILRAYKTKNIKPWLQPE